MTGQRISTNSLAVVAIDFTVLFVTVTMTHQFSGGLGAWTGAAIFDADGGYDTSFAIMLGCSIAALLLSFCLRRVPRRK